MRISFRSTLLLFQRANRVGNPKSLNYDLRNNDLQPAARDM
jgi:hypothetical protein